jgi:hypothetical protein
MNVVLIYFWAAFYFSKRCPESQKRVYYSWLAWALSAEVINVLSYDVAVVVSAAAIVIGPISLYLANHIEEGPVAGSP